MALLCAHLSQVVCFLGGDWAENNVLGIQVVFSTTLKGCTSVSSSRLQIDLCFISNTLGPFGNQSEGFCSYAQVAELQILN